jgi:nitrogenase molybdenum-cofactor synthesis protein NifE
MGLSTKELKNLRNEPACSDNSGEKTGCARAQPGATAGGCCLDGALIALLPIGDAAHLVHGSIACVGSAWGIRGSASSGPALYKMGMSTDLSETDVIMGRSEEKLLQSIRHILNHYHPKAIFIYETCLTALIGDDLKEICKLATQKTGIPVIAVPAAGFYGSKNLGNRIAGEVLVKNVIGTREPPPLPHQEGIQVHTLNLIGEFNIAGEFWNVLPLLDELGILVRGSISGDARFDEIQTMHRAEASMVVCSKALLNVARSLEERYGIPWFEGSFYGVRDTSKALRQITGLIGDSDLIQRTETLIAREERLIEARLTPLRERLIGKKALLYTGGVKSWSVLSALQDDLGMSVVATGIRKSTEEDKARIREISGDEIELLTEGAASTLIGTADRHQIDVMIAGGRNMYTALKARIPFLHINQERECAYAGYQGTLTLANELVRTIGAPVWTLTRSTAPWLSDKQKPEQPESQPPGHTAGQSAGQQDEQSPRSSHPSTES